MELLLEPYITVLRMLEARGCLSESSPIASSENIIWSYHLWLKRSGTAGGCILGLTESVLP
jgi:hypothetical protein